MSRSPVRVAVAGVRGRMGQTLARLALQTPGLVLTGVTARGTEGLPLLPPTVRVAEELESLLTGGAVGVVVDFTVAESVEVHARACAKAGVAWVLGTTGLDEDAQAAVQAASRRIPVVAAPNFSVGVFVLARLAEQAARALGEDFDVEVLELHHRMKRDAPSGTALRLAEAVSAARGTGRETWRTERSGLIGARPKCELGLQTLRGGDVVGEHTVYFLGEGERVELSHRATSRDTVASGALRTARWLAGKAPGRYGLDDVLGL